jgi:hypothetical protein
MKAIIGGFLLISMIIWVMWARSGKTDCDQVERFASPVNIISFVARSLSENWIEKETQDSLILWSIQGREMVQKVVARTFYSKDLVCYWSEVEENSSDKKNKKEKVKEDKNKDKKNKQKNEVEDKSNQDK